MREWLHLELMNLEGTLAEVSVKEKKTKIAFILLCFQMTLCPLGLTEKDVALGSHLEDTE